MNPLLLGPLMDIGKGLIDRLFPDKTAQERERAAAELELLKMQQDGAFREAQQQMSAILAEAQSADPWTSRARPTFLYVVYVMILMAIPMGFVAAWRPELAQAVAAGMKAWLDAIPEDMWMLFGVGYLGYTGARMWEKGKGVTR